MGKRSENIEHPGVVQKLEGEKVFVKIEAQAACGSCHSKSYCGMVESVDKVVEVSHTGASPPAPGTRVLIVLEKSLGYKALFLGYLFPFFVLLFSLFLMVSLTANEGLAALVSVILMAIYYFILFQNREKVKKEFNFRLRIPPSDNSLTTPDC